MVRHRLEESPSHPAAAMSGVRCQKPDRRLEKRFGEGGRQDVQQGHRRAEDTRRYPIAPRHLRQAGARLHRLLNDPAFVRFTKLPPMPIACRRHDRLRAAVSHMTKAITNAMTKGMT